MTPPTAGVWDVPGTALSTLQGLSHVTPPAFLGSRYYDHPHSTDEECPGTHAHALSMEVSEWKV